MILNESLKFTENISRMTSDLLKFDIPVLDYDQRHS